MPLQLLLLTLLGPGSSLQLGAGAKEASDHLPTQGQSQVSKYDGFIDKNFDAYFALDYTDPPEMLENNATEAVTLSPNLQALMGMLGQRDSAGPGTPEPATLEEVSAGLDARGAAIRNLSMELVTEGITITPGPMPKELVTSIPPIMEAPTTEGAPSTELATVKALSIEPVATESLATQPAATAALATQPAATETLSTRPAATEALSTELSATASPSTEPATTETLSKDPDTMKAPTTQRATTWGLTTALHVPSDAGTTVAVSSSSDGFIKQQKTSQGLSTPSPVPPSPTGGLNYIPVKHCLLAIFILALVATTFLVCTVVLAVRLSRKNHMYPVRNYSPTEMVCISSLLPEGGEEPAVTANGSLPTAKKPGLKEGSREHRDGDDLTLHSFLP